jgi:hypothetical protein
MDNLRLAFYKAKRGKTGKKDILSFQKNLDSNLFAVYESLQKQEFRFGAYNYFKVHDPKERTICAASFPERIVHHAIMNLCASDFERYQIFDSYACRIGKGVFAAVERIRFFQNKYKWYAKLDVRKYFDNIDHRILFEQLCRMYKDEKLLKLLWQIIESYSHPSAARVGVPIGNLTSQYFANHYLSFADRYIKETLQTAGYVRYMDDMLLWANTKEELQGKLKLIETFFATELNLHLKPAVINKAAHGLPALGFVVFAGKIRLNRRSKLRFLSKSKEYICKYENEEIGEKQCRQGLQALYGFICHADIKGLITTGFGNEGSNRVNRGGSWNNNARNARVSNRNNNNPDNRNNNIGFRVACSTEQSFHGQLPITLPTTTCGDGTNIFPACPDSSRNGRNTGRLFQILSNE